MMDGKEQHEWLVKHIPYRVRAASARLQMEKSPLQVQALIDPDPARRDEKDKIFWRFATDSIWEGRLAATRWLIEFVGIKQSNGQPSQCEKSKTNDVRISDFDGGEALRSKIKRRRVLGKHVEGMFAGVKPRDKRVQSSLYKR